MSQHDTPSPIERLHKVLRLSEQSHSWFTQVMTSDLQTVLDALDEAGRWQWAIELALSERALVWCEECSTIGTRSTSNAALCEECVLDHAIAQESRS